MRRLVAYLSIAFILVLLYGGLRYARRRQPRVATTESASRAAPAQAVIPVSDGFDYPVGESGRATGAKDGDGWYVARDFGESNHLGEDWNKESGGNTDCGLPVYAASKGYIIFAGEAGPGWGKVLILRHRLQDGTLVETLYGHLGLIERTSGMVERREKIGQIGDADGAYPCHLHFELRLSDSPSWGAVGPGYSSNRTGWTDPSRFMDSRRNLTR